MIEGDVFAVDHDEMLDRGCGVSASRTCSKCGIWKGTGGEQSSQGRCDEPLHVSLLSRRGNGGNVFIVSAN
jgi:hypothetical protein